VTKSDLPSMLDPYASPAHDDLWRLYYRLKDNPGNDLSILNHILSSL